MLARDTEVRWGEHRGIDKGDSDLKARVRETRRPDGRPRPFEVQEARGRFGPLVDLNREYVRLRR